MADRATKRTQNNTGILHADVLVELRMGGDVERLCLLLDGCDGFEFVREEDDKRRFLVDLEECLPSC